MKLIFDGLQFTDCKPLFFYCYRIEGCKTLISLKNRQLSIFNILYIIVKYCQPLTVNYKLSTIRHQYTVGKYCQLLTVNHKLSTIHHQYTVGKYCKL